MKVELHCFIRNALLDDKVVVNYFGLLGNKLLQAYQPVTFNFWQTQPDILLCHHDAHSNVPYAKALLAHRNRFHGITLRSFNHKASHIFWFTAKIDEHQTEGGHEYAKRKRGVGLNITLRFNADNWHPQLSIP